MKIKQAKKWLREGAARVLVFSLLWLPMESSGSELRHSGERLEWLAVAGERRSQSVDAKWVAVPSEGNIMGYASLRSFPAGMLQYQEATRQRQVVATVTYRVKVEVAGVYRLWYQGAGVDRSADSALVRIRELMREFEMLENRALGYGEVSWRVALQAFEIKEAGYITVEVGNRENGFWLSRLALERL